MPLLYDNNRSMWGNLWRTCSAPITFPLSHRVTVRAAPRRPVTSKNYWDLTNYTAVTLEFKIPLICDIDKSKWLC